MSLQHFYLDEQVLADEVGGPFPLRLAADDAKHARVLRLAPGERITKEILEHIQYAKEKGCSMTGPEDPEIHRINVLA